MSKFTHYYQSSQMDCGPTCLRMVSKYYGKDITLRELSKVCGVGKQGVSILGISQGAEVIGFKTTRVQVTFDQLINEAPLPAILHWGQNHFVTVLPQSNRKKVIIADPSRGMISYSKADFNRHWLKFSSDTGDRYGIALLLEPTAKLAEYKTATEGRTVLNWHSLSGYLRIYKRFFFQLFLALALGGALQLIFPFLTQSIVDTGIATQDLSFVTIVLIGQLMLFLSRTVVEFIRSRLLLHISLRINLSILSDFWIKLMRLPISYFDVKQTGDTLRRIVDHKRIESFLTGIAPMTVFSIVNILIFSLVLLSYNFNIFLVFIIGSLLYFFWIRFFLRYRRKLDYEQFELASAENSMTLQMIMGMQEIKLSNAEQIHRWEWENLQARLFKLSFKGLSINQYQQAGAIFFSEGKNIVITFISAQLVIGGQLSLGAMLAIQYIIGQLQSPIEQLLTFMQAAQDARISMDRLNEIHTLDDEEPTTLSLNDKLPGQKTIHINNLVYAYPGAAMEPVLKNLSLTIPEGKTTAIVGVSGSGKTTLIKLLLRFYEDYKGDIMIGNSPLQSISHRTWRESCGCVMQEGFIFNDTIARNIAVNTQEPEYEKLIHSCEVANVLNFIDSLPQGFNTRIGADGKGISSGQRQRLLIARAVYKNPHYIFFDEATNSLDANNEKIILENLNQFFQGKTVVIVAHRLSTVKNADQIIVIEDGEIKESGTHVELSGIRGKYFELVKNQLELGK